MEAKLIDGYKYIGIKEGVCGGRPIILGTRLEPRQIVRCGSIEETMEDFHLSLEQVKECYLFVVNSDLN